MPQESEHFRCPICGQHAPIERLTEEGPFELAAFRKTLGGKTKFTYEERRERGRKESYRGAAPGALEYDEIPVTRKLRQAFKKRLGEVEV